MTQDEDPYSKEHEEPLFVVVRADDPEIMRRREHAQRTLPVFLRIYSEHKSTFGVFFSFKTPIADGDVVAHLWYSFSGESNGMLLGESFELPPELSDRKLVTIVPEHLDDWMINDHGVLYGGFSIRYQRSLLPEERRANYDRYIGAVRYADIE